MTATLPPPLADLAWTPLPSNAAALRASVDAGSWYEAARALHAAGADLLTLWGEDERDRGGGFRVNAAYLLREHLLVTALDLPDDATRYPSLATLFPVTARLQRAVRDLLGIGPDGGDERPWLQHGGWPQDRFPLRRDVDPAQTFPMHGAPYPFTHVTGDGVHEIPVGPVHAGTIEPGHFRFSVVGEKVLRLEQRLGYTHKGVAKRFEHMPARDGHRLAARVCGDSAVAFSWAYCAALEAAAATVVPARALELRALALERERIANHLGDLGALGNDAGFAFGLTQFSILKERLLRRNADAFGQRYLFDFIVPGGVARDLPGAALPPLLDELGELEHAIAELHTLYDDHAGVQDRFTGTGGLTPQQAGRLGAIGLAARASGSARDLRVDRPWAPYDRLVPVAATRTQGDVAARVQVRFAETIESLRLCRQLLDTLSGGARQTGLTDVPAGRLGAGAVEGWRGPVAVMLETGAEGGIRRCHVHDPSWQNWPLLEVAIADNIVPDFPLINKSFNLSYSGHDG